MHQQGGILVRHLIVGVDPGTTIGIAVLDLQGNLLSLFSSKNLSLDAVLSHIMSLGTATVVATDVSPTPKFVEKVATSLGAVLFTPQDDVPVQEKMSTVSSFIGDREIKVENFHERDSLAAALKAFHHFEPKIKSVAAKAFEDGVDIDSALDLVLRGVPYARAIMPATEKCDVLEEQKTVDVPSEKLVPLLQRLREKVLLYERRLAALERRNAEIEQALNGKEKEIMALKKASTRAEAKLYTETLKSRQVSVRDKKISEMVKKFAELNSKLQAASSLLSKYAALMERLDRGEVDLLVAVEDLTKEGMFSKLESLREGSLVYVLNPCKYSVSELNSLLDKHIGALISVAATPKEIKEICLRRATPLLQLKKGDVQCCGEMFFADSGLIASKISGWDEEVKEYRENREEWFSDELKDYRFRNLR